MAFDVAVVGGGIVGAACADALAGAGLGVCLIERGPPAREASWASAGILHPIRPWIYPDALQPLLRAGAAEHLRCIPDLQERTGADVGLDRTGLLVMGEEIPLLEEWCGTGPSHRRVDAAREAPGVRVGGEGLLLPDAMQVTSHRLARAFLEGARRRGARVLPFTPATAIRAGAVETPAGRIEAGKIVLCAGAWSGTLRVGLEVEPVRGQILLYRGSLRRMVVFPGGEYAVPRQGGVLLFGSTLERVGFDSRPTREACEALAKRAEALLGLRPEDLLAAWAGLRPGTPGGLPWLGPDPGVEWLIHASGHYRNGILLAPLTARIVVDLVVGRPHGIDLGPFAVNVNRLQ